MKKIGFIISFALVLGACQSKKGIEIGQKTTMDVRMEYNAGEVLLGEEVQAKFTVRNTGNYPLIISEVKASCSCTVADYPEDPIAPGESGIIKAQVKTENAQVGQLTKEVRVMANTAPATTVLLIKADIVRK